MLTQQQLQQIKAVLSDNLCEINFWRQDIKTNILILVKQKKSFIEAKEKVHVDTLNDAIRNLYNQLDVQTERYKSLSELQRTIKREISEFSKNQNIKKPYTSKTTGLAKITDAITVCGKSYDIFISNKDRDQMRKDYNDARSKEILDSVVTDSNQVEPLIHSFSLPSKRYSNNLCEEILTKQEEVKQVENNTYAKPSNPKEAIGSGKLPLHLWPTTASAMGCIGFLNGMLKYGRSNFRAIGIRASIYYDAAIRHLNAWFEGEECDPDDGVPHLAAALACIGIIVDAIAAGKFNDDRSVKGGYRNLVDELTPHVTRLKLLHASKDPHHYTIADNPELELQ